METFNTYIFAEQALLPKAWAENVRLKIEEDGRIGDMQVGALPEVGDKRVAHLLPAPVNVHSHAFQRAMAGMTERRGPHGRDSFWTWRQLMFRFLDHLSPEHVQAIAAFVQMEMLEAGYGASVEFHYLHHQPGGVPYDNPAELSERIIAAAQTSGIGLTLLPVLYQVGGCDGRPLEQGQIRFGNDMAGFAKLKDGAAQALRNLPSDAQIGIAPHSLRAVPPESLSEIVALTPNGPIHMHLAEQLAEVEEVEAHLGARPATWLMNHLPVDERWCLIHCTQMHEEETRALAKTGAVAGLCPITEASLGDGIFDGCTWLQAGGAMAVGSDSNIRISLNEELRMLEYSQRLRDRARAVLADADRSNGRLLYDTICAGGAQAAARSSGQIAAGCWADLVALKDDAIDLQNRHGDELLDSFIFAGNSTMVADTWSAGRHLVQEGRHIRREEIIAQYRQTQNELRERL